MWHPIRNSLYSLSLVTLALVALLALGEPVANATSQAAEPLQAEHTFVQSVDALSAHLPIDDAAEKALAVERAQQVAMHNRCIRIERKRNPQLGYGFIDAALLEDDAGERMPQTAGAWYFREGLTATVFCLVIALGRFQQGNQLQPDILQIFAQG